METAISGSMAEIMKLGMAGFMIVGLLWDRRQILKDKADLYAMCMALQEKRVTEGAETRAALIQTGNVLEKTLDVLNRGHK